MFFEKDQHPHQDPARAEEGPVLADETRDQDRGEASRVTVHTGSVTPPSTALGKKSAAGPVPESALPRLFRYEV
ncbi:hypothetical protein ACQPW3_27295 [Actinosynnema sp. CA-248983]